MITSALYGVIPAFAPIAPHRLDFLMKFKIAGKSLKSHWQSAYEESVKDEELIFSLLSSEFETVFPKEVREQMVTFKFMEDRDGKLKVHSTISKKARGCFLNSLDGKSGDFGRRNQKAQLCRFPLSRRPVYWQGIGFCEID